MDSNDLEIVVQSGLIKASRQVQRVLCIRDSLSLRACLLCQNSRCGELIFHLLKCLESRFFVVRSALVMAGDSLGLHGMPSAVSKAERNSILKFRSLQIRFARGLLAILAIQWATINAQQVSTKPPPISDTTISSPVLLQPNELVQMLGTPEKPLILQVGSHVLYAEGHIPGSEYVGAAGTSAGIQALRERVSGLNRNQFIVIYCGCCPWNRCPNIRPAYEQLHTLGFTHVRVLYVADNFGTNWVDKGYPVAKGR